MLENLTHRPQFVDRFLHLRERAVLPKPRVLVPILLSSMLLINACGPSSNSSERTSVVFPFPDEAKYPEIENFPLKDSGDFPTTTGSINWMNYTDIKFNPAEAARIFRYIQEWPGKAPILRFPWAGQTVTADFQKRTNRKTLFYLIPENAPAPKWSTSDQAFTRILGYSNGEEQATSFVRTRPPKNSFAEEDLYDVIDKDALHNLTIEACQSSIRLNSLQMDYKEIQELLCNSIGFAFFMRLHNYPYDYYIRMAGLITMTDLKGHIIPHLGFSQSTYEDLPTVKVFSS